MRRIASRGLLITFLTGLLLTACSREAPRLVEPAAEERPALAGSPVSTPAPAVAAAEAPAIVGAEITPQEKYDAALLDALNLLAERKLPEALAALEAARSVQDTEQVRREIDKLKRLQQQQAAVEQTLLDIQTVLKDGKAEEAARLTTLAMQQYGGTDAAEQLARLKRQADALAAAALDDNAARRGRFRAEAEAALRDKNFRAAALAYESALQYGDDAGLRRQLEEVRTTLTRYDDHRRRAAELRRDPVQLEEALAALHEAARVWDTLQVRQEIDECTLALQKRRDRISVADFEVRGEVGIPFAGRALADELLPHFKARFDLVERSQLARVVAELKLEASGLAADEAGRREVGRLARLRYLVLGSITPLGGLTVHARLVDVRSGLVVQTARVVAGSPEEAVALLPRLASLLQMTDEQRIAYEQQLAQQAAVQPVVVAPLPPPPPVVVVQPPPPVIVHAVRPPDLGGLQPADFDRLPPPPPPGQSVQVAVAVGKGGPFKDRMLQVAIQLGDNLYQRGCYREAQAQFELALTLAPDHKDVRLRVERCRPHLPPPPPVVVVAPRPRVAVLNFVTAGDPRFLPPGLGACVAEQIAPYFCPPYDVVDRGEVFWYMGRLGLTLRDLLTDPDARRYLARALDVRYFVFGTLRHQAGIDATAHLVDAEYGFEQGGGRIHVHDPYELKLRLAELARLTLLPPQERVVYVRQVETSQALLVQARTHSERGEFTLALGIYRKAQQARPDSVEVQVLLQRTEQQARLAELEEARRLEFERQQALALEYQRQQAELAREAEAARRRAERDAVAQANAQRELQFQQAYSQLVQQGQVAMTQQNFVQAVHIFESALALRKTDAVFQLLAQAKVAAAQTAQVRLVQEQAARDAQLRQQQEAEVARARAQLEDERRRREAELEAQRKAQEFRDQAEYTKLLDQAQRQLAQEKYDPAVAALQRARQLRKTDEVERLLNQALVEQARAKAQQQGAQARAELERQLAEEKARRETAEAEARRNRELYTQALQAAQRAMAEKRYETALVKYQEAAKVFRTDDALSGLKAAEEARAKEKAQAEAARRQQEEEQKKAATVQRLLDEGRRALAAKQYDAAAKAFSEANRLAPGNVDVLAGLSKAEQGRDEAAAEARRRQEAARPKPAAPPAPAVTQTPRPQPSPMPPPKVEAPAKPVVPPPAPKPVVQPTPKPAEPPAPTPKPEPKVEAPAKPAAPTEPAKPVVPAAKPALPPAPVPKPAPQPKVETPPAKPTPPVPPKPAVEPPPLPKPAPKPEAPKPAAQPMPSSPAPSKPAEQPKPAPQPAAPAKPATQPAPGTPKTTPAPQPANPPKPATQPAAPPKPAPQPAPEAKPPAPPTANAQADFAKCMAEGKKLLSQRRFADAAKQFEAALKLSPGNPEATKLLKQAKEGKP